MKIYRSEFNSPIGIISIFAGNRGIIRLSWNKELEDLTGEKWFKGTMDIKWDSENEISQEARSQLERYFNKQLTRFDVPLHLTGTIFQQAVWKQLQKIPFGRTWSYQQLASAVGKPAAVRAVGNANGRNPIPVIIPCHRVIQKDGKIGGYSGGIEIKDWLLEHEGVLL